jgi:hypothetical protein
MVEMGTAEGVRALGETGEVDQVAICFTYPSPG